MLLEFYGTECGHCQVMKSLVARLVKETGVEVQEYETWHNEANEMMRQKYDTVGCGGVPFFVNTDTGAVICGEVSYEELRAWAAPKG